MKLSQPLVKHVIYAVTAAALAGVAAWQAVSGHMLVVGGIGVASVLTTLKALEDQAGIK